MALRTLGPGSGLIPSAEATPTQIMLAFEDNRHASVLFGQYGQNLALIERRLNVVADQRGNHVTLEGSRDAVEQARRVLEGLYEQIKRGNDLVARLAGDEFVTLLTRGDHAALYLVAQRIVQALAIEVRGPDGQAVKVTASVGVVTWPAGTAKRSAEHLLAEADRAMYRAKTADGNQLVIERAQ